MIKHRETNSFIKHSLCLVYFKLFKPCGNAVGCGEAIKHQLPISAPLTLGSARMVNVPD